MTKIVQPKLLAEMQTKLRLAVAAKMGEAMTEAGMKEKLTNDIKTEYTEGTLKAAQAMVTQHFRSIFQLKLKNQAMNLARRDATTAAAHAVEIQVEAMKKKYFQEFELQGDKALQKKIELSIVGMSPADAEQINAELTKKETQVNREKVDVTITEQLPALKAKIFKDLYDQRLIIETALINAKLIKMESNKAQAITDAAIQRKIRTDVDRISEPEAAVFNDDDAPTPEVIEKAMVAAVVVVPKP